MRFGLLTMAAVVALLTPCLALAGDPPAAATQTPESAPTLTPASTPTPAVPPVSTSDDRIAVSLNGSTLPRTNGGGGGSAGWLHNFDADALAGAAIEHQVISVSHWTFGSLNGVLTRGTGDARYSFYGEAHEGAGDDGPHPFKYAIEALGLIGTYFHRFSAQLEDRQIEVEKTHGNLPKVGVSYLWNPHIYTTVSYIHSVSGDLGTRLTSGRIDLYGPRLNYLAGVSFGQASPAILNSGFHVPGGGTLKEAYVGATKAFPHLRGDLSLVADYQDLSGSPRFALTLNYIFHVGHNGKSK
jgi:hypothetical protein